MIYFFIRFYMCDIQFTMITDNRFIFYGFIDKYEQNKKIPRIKVDNNLSYTLMSQKCLYVCVCMCV